MILMKKFILLLFFMILVQSVAISQDTSKNAFPIGEKIKFKIYYGWFGLGEATMSLGDEIISKNGKEFYNSKIEAKTIGLFSWLAGLTNEYWGYVGTENYKTSIAETHLDERKGKFDQWNTFDWDKMVTNVLIMDYSRDNPKKEVSVKLNSKTYDMHGTYMYLRSKLLSGHEVGDKIMLNTYWEDKLYDFGMEYGGTERIKFNGEKITAYKFYGLFPITKTFPKEKAVVVWVIERDGIGIPLIIEADLKIGKVRCELKEYSIKGKEIITAD
jgi:hypothetical protein